MPPSAIQWSIVVNAMKPIRMQFGYRESVILPMVIRHCLIGILGFSKSSERVLKAVFASLEGKKIE